MNIFIIIFTLLIFTLTPSQLVEYCKLNIILILLISIKDRELSLWVFKVLFIPIVIVLFVCLLVNLLV